MKISTKLLSDIVSTSISFTLIAIMAFSFTNINVANAQSGDTDTSGSNGNSCVTLDNNLRYRMRDSSVNNEVSDLQDYLIAEGYLSGNTTGYFGVATLKAVKSFQAANGLLSSGYVGPVTRAKIKSLSCEAVMSPTNPPMPTKPVTCTTEYRSCPDGTAMYRDTNCGWHAEMCKQVNVNGDAKITSLAASVMPDPSTRDTPLFKIEVYGQNLNTIDYLQTEMLVNGTQNIYRSSFVEASDNKIVFNHRVCAGCKYMLSISTRGKAQNPSNVMSIQIDNTTPVPANALKAVSATLYNTNTTYAPGQQIKFSLQGYDSNGQVATPAKGFHVQWHMYDYRDSTYINNTTMINGTYQGDNAVFNYSTNMWDITATAPSANLASGAMRKLEASFYCSNTSLGCYSSYENQIEKSFMFLINSAQPTISSNFKCYSNNMSYTIRDYMSNCPLVKIEYGTYYSGLLSFTKTATSTDANVISVIKNNGGILTEEHYVNSSFYTHVYFQIPWTKDSVQNLIKSLASTDYFESIMVESCCTVIN